MAAGQRSCIFQLNVFVLIYISLCVCQGEEECVRFKTDTDTVYAEPNSQVTVNFTFQQLCYPRLVAIDYITAVVQREHPPHVVICEMLYRSGSCFTSTRCICKPGGFSVSKTVGDGERERWMIRGYGNMAERLAELAVDIVIKDTTVPPGTSTMPPVTTESTRAESVGFRFPLGIFLSVVISPAVIIIVVILAVFCCRRRHVSDQVNPRSAEVEMVPLYSRLDLDVHHYLSLPPNRRAPTEDNKEDGDGGEGGGQEGGYLDLIDSDSESRPESNIYQVPRDSQSPRKAPADYLHPVASAQEAPKLPKRRAPADDLHPGASAQERPSSPSNAQPEDNLHPVASAQEPPFLPSNAPEGHMQPLAPDQERPSSPSNVPEGHLQPLAPMDPAQERPSSPSDAREGHMQPLALAQERPSSPTNAQPEGHQNPVAPAQERPPSPSNVPEGHQHPVPSAQDRMRRPLQDIL